MSLQEEMTRSGAWLFRWRSYVPLLLLPAVLAALAGFHDIAGSQKLQTTWELICFGIAMFGLSIRVLTVGFVPAGTSGRNTRQQLATALNTTGAYAVVRHPLYVGNSLIWLGVMSFLHAWWLIVIAMLVFWVYYERIMLAEEGFLKVSFGAAFEEWARRTPAFIPSVRNWTPPVFPFSWRSVLARENSTLLSIIVSFCALDVSGDFLVGNPPGLDDGWLVLLCADLVFYAVVRWMKRHDLLAVEGR